ncbi:protein jagunal homolog 1-like [Mizuhopecten yessoensis]|uniref:protein jagunal homolog 1-like n=1 Tax=Mizuhopecten yessoensis TaxID=6573 RepID=UPI000B45A575|nr:protein jagunal homolog 1-like [Mizuhopecten yessoensis]
MASKYGSRPTGTDGSDFWHRESVAWQYKQSSLNKSRLKIVLVLEVLVCLMLVVRLLPGMTAFLGLGIFGRLKTWDFPAPRPWEYIWMINLMAGVLGLKSLPKNDIPLLRQYVIGTVVFGICPVVYGIFDQIDDLYAYLNEKKSIGTIQGFPAVIVWFMFLTMAIQLHGFGLYFARQLHKSWKPRLDKKKN